MPDKIRFGELLQASGLIDEEQLDEALQRQQANRQPLGSLLREMGVLSERMVGETLARQFDVPFVELSQETLDPQTANLVPITIAKRYCCMPMRREGERLIIAVGDPMALFALQELTPLDVYDLEIVVASPSDILWAINHIYFQVFARVAEDLPVEEAVDASAQQLDRMGIKTQLFAVCSNKGGVGKTHLSINLAYHLANTYKRRTLLVDLDLGNANISSKLGMFGRRTLLDALENEAQVKSLVLSTPHGFHFIPSRSGEMRLANLTTSERLRFLKNFNTISRFFDVVLLDLGAGIHHNVLDFALAADETLVVTTPTELLSALGCIRAAYARFRMLEDECARAIPDYKRRTNFRPKVILNQLNTLRGGLDIFQRLAHAVDTRVNALTNSDTKCFPEYLGGVLLDNEAFRAAERRRQPFSTLYPRRQATHCFDHLASTLLARPAERNPHDQLKSRFRRFVEILRPQKVA